MDGYYLYLILISLLSFGMYLVYSFLVRKITFSGIETDNELMTYAASQSHKWRWISDLHKYAHGKTQMKDVTIILIAIFQKILGKSQDRPYVTLGGFANGISAILIYIIASFYFDPMIGTLLSVLFLISFWPWQVSLFTAHINVSIMTFLFAVIFAQQASGWNMPILLGLSGVMFVFTMFASASSSKFMIPFYAVLFYEKFKMNIMDSGLIATIRLNVFTNEFLFIVISIIGLNLIILALLKLSYKKLVERIYDQKAPLFLNKMMEGRHIFDLRHYIKHAEKKINILVRWLLRLSLVAAIVLYTLDLNFVFPILAGSTIAFLLLTFPNVRSRAANYMEYQFHIQRKTHFRIYLDFFQKRGIAVTRQTRGGGFSWVPRLFIKLIPFHLAIFIALLSYLLVNSESLEQVLLIIFMALLSLSPAIWGELTRGVQLSRSYLSTLVLMLVFIGYGFSLILNIQNLFIYTVIAIILIFIWNLRQFFSDVLPARIVISNLIDKLDELHIKEIYSYDTDYNNTLVNCLPKEKYLVNRIKSIKDIKEGWIVIPRISSKAFDMESEQEGIRDGDYAKDDILNKLISTKDIEKVAKFKFKTMGTSRIWVHESEVSSYRDIFLHDVTKEDIFKGFAWLINAKDLSDFLATNNYG